MTADKLPPCPLCGCLPEPYGDGICVWCGGLDGESRSNACPLRREDSCFTPDEWRRLAAVDLRAEVERLTNAEQVDADTIRRLREALEHGVEHKRKAEARAEKAEAMVDWLAEVCAMHRRGKSTDDSQCSISDCGPVHCRHASADQWSEAARRAVDDAESEVKA